MYKNASKYQQRGLRKLARIGDRPREKAAPPSKGKPTPGVYAMEKAGCVVYVGWTLDILAMSERLEASASEDFDDFGCWVGGSPEVLEAMVRRSISMMGNGP